jgi:hypothetical protein
MGAAAEAAPGRILRTQPFRKMIPSLAGGNPFAVNRAPRIACWFDRPNTEDTPERRKAPRRRVAEVSVSYGFAA